MFVPNWVGVYGSRYTQASLANYDVIQIPSSLLECYHYEMKITKSGLKALDQPSERCDSLTTFPNTSECITKYIEEKLGCSMKIHGGGISSQMPLCKSKSDLDALKNLTTKLQDATANKIYEVTGCMASCERNEYAKVDGHFMKKFSFGGPYDLLLKFIIYEGSYKEEEQYTIYDFNSFIGGVGGILGLCNLLAMVLVGCGVMNVHSQLADMLGGLKNSTHRLR